MKIIKLDNRHRSYKWGYTHALRFDQYYSQEAGAVEKFLSDSYGGCIRNYNWNGYFGRRDTVKGLPAPYWVCVKKESMLTMAILSIP